MIKEPNPSHKNANNTCQVHLMLSSLISIILCMILDAVFFNFSGAVTAGALFCVFLNYIIWRILVKRFWGYDAFEG